MPAPRRLPTLNTRIAIPIVLTAAVLVGISTTRGTGAKPTATPAVAPVALAPDGTMTLEGLLALTPEALLQALPDPGTKTASAKEVARWRDAAKKESGTMKNWVNLGDALMQRSRELVDPHYYDYAHAVYAIVLKKEPQSADALIGMAWVSGGRHQFDQSIAYAQQAIALNGNNPAPFGLIGDAQVEMGDYDAAYDSYQKMLDIRPDAASYSRGAHLLFLTGNTTKAMQLMSLAVKAGGPYTENGAWCRAQLADMLWQTGMLVPAEIVLKDAIKAAPDNYYVQTTLGRLQESRGKSSEAEAAYKKAIATSPQHAALVALGDLYLSQGKAAQAEEIYKQVEVTNAHHQQHGNHDQYHMAGFYADHDRKLDQALKIVESRAPKSPMDQEIAAWVYFKNGKLPEAQEQIEGALKKGSPMASRLFKAGMIYAGQGNRRRAQQSLNDALAKNPHFNLLQVKIAAQMLNDLGSRPPEGGRRVAEKSPVNDGKTVR